jgi:hypothetical protein
MATARALRPRLLPTAAVLVACVGCDSTDQPMAPDSAPPAYAISDAPHEGMPHFFLLPPLVDAPAARGTFDATLAPTVEICALRSSACGEIIASFTKDAGPGGEVITVDREREQYQVDWKTDEFALSDATNYRIVVRVSAVLLGYVDVDVARNASQFKNLNTNEVIGLVDGRTLPIKFRAERGIPGRLVASPSEARVGEGDQLQLRAVVYDLHDEVVAETFRVRWTTSDTDVALVDDTGLLLAKAAGRATVGLSLGSLQALVATVNIFARRLAFVSTRPAPGGVNDIYTVNGLGGDLKLLTGEPGEPYVSNQPAWSPGGTKLAYQYAQRDIVVMNDDGTGKTHLTQNLANHVYTDANPVWSPDGARIAFDRDVSAEKQTEIYVMNADGTGLTNLSHDPDATDSLPSWSPDGTRIAFLKNDAPYVVKADGSGTPLPLISTDPVSGSGGFRPAWSPNGTRIAFVLDYDIAVVAPDGSGLAKLTNDGVSVLQGGPVWSPDGSRLYFGSAVPGGGVGEIRVVNADGTGNQLVVANAGIFSLTSDGVRLAFVRDVAPAPVGGCCGNEEVFKAYTDGTGQVNLSNSTGPDSYPVWRP